MGRDRGRGRHWPGTGVPPRGVRAAGARAEGFKAFGTQYRPVKSAEAYCPTGTLPAGGGGWVDDDGSNLVRLTGLIPRPRLGPPGQEGGYFEAVAEAPADLDRPFNWSVSAFALCAAGSALAGYTLEFADSVGDHRSFQTAQAFCPPGTVAFGARAQVQEVYRGHVGLQLVRTSNPLDSARAAAHDDERLVGPWHVTAIAVCAEPAGGIHAEGELDPGPAAAATCESGFVHGPGGGGLSSGGGPVWLNKIYPNANLRTVSVGMTGPLDPSVGDMVTHMTCAH